MAISGALLLVMALSSAHVRRLPISTSIVYLAVGVAIGPLGLGLVRLDLAAIPEVVERATEVAVIISLFVSGLKLRVSLRDQAWRAVYRLAGPLMLLCIAGVAASCHFVFGVPAAAALLIGAILAPTDPVLASAVAVSDSRDCDRLRYALSGEAGLNDGMAFPFVVFGLAWLEHGLGGWVGGWALSKLVWAVPAGLVLGLVLGRGVGRLAIWLRARNAETNAPNDLLVLALICLSYVAAEQIHAWGFLAVFAAGLGLRRAEIKVVQSTPHPDVEQRTPEHDESHPPAEHLVSASVEGESLKQPAVAAGVLVAATLSFGETLERLIEFVLIVGVGVAIASHWDARGLVIATLLFFVIRPLGTALALLGTPTTRAQRLLIGWFGIRGVGSLYYLGYALTHGFSGAAMRDGVAVVVTVIAVSIVLHGASSTPLIDRYERRLRERSASA